MVLCLKVKQLNLLLIIQKHIWKEESFYQTFVFRAYRKLSLLFSNREWVLPAVIRYCKQQCECSRMQGNTVIGLSDTPVLTSKHIAYSFLLLSLPCICFIPQDNHCVLPWWRCSCGLDRLRLNLGTAEPAAVSWDLAALPVCNTSAASFLLLRVCRTSLDKPRFSGAVQCLFQYLEGIYSSTDSVGLAFCGAGVIWTFTCTKENVQDLTKMPFFNRSSSSVSLLACLLICLMH